MDLRETDALEGADPQQHWYYASKSYPLYREFREALSQNGRAPIPIADVGAGDGVFTRALIRRFPGAISHATLIDSGYASDESGFMEGVPVNRVRDVPARLDARLILLMDVLEHIERELEFLMKVVAAAAPGTRFFVTAPAFSFLWSKHDEYLGHFRRYRLSELASVCRRGGLRPHARFYFFATIFPAVVALRAVSPENGKASDLRPAHPAVNALLKKLLFLESFWCRANRLLGVSAVICARSVSGPMEDTSGDGAGGVQNSTR
jgi:hypothetical protein